MHDNDSACSNRLLAFARIHVMRPGAWKAPFTKQAGLGTWLHDAFSRGSAPFTILTATCSVSQHEVHVALSGGNSLTHPIQPSRGILVSIAWRALPEYNKFLFFSLSLRGDNRNQCKQQPRDSSDRAKQSPTILRSRPRCGARLYKTFRRVELYSKLFFPLGSIPPLCVSITFAGLSDFCDFYLSSLCRISVFTVACTQ